LAAEKDENFVAVKKQMTQDLEDTLNKFTDTKKAELAQKDRELQETINHHEGQFKEMKADLEGAIATKMAEINELVLDHRKEIVSLTTSKNEDIDREKTIHEQTKQDLGGKISQLTEELASAHARIAVISP